ncbi:MAG: hypothetical protein KAU14_05455, partial [Thermoplasmata archaeon]|nr:hypothetical protein [Thermoplasmata archaeon]
RVIRTSELCSSLVIRVQNSSSKGRYGIALLENTNKSGMRRLGGFTTISLGIQESLQCKRRA